MLCPMGEQPSQYFTKIFHQSYLHGVHANSMLIPTPLPTQEPSQLCALLALCNQTAVDAATRPSATPAKLTAHPVLQLMQLQASSKSAITPQKPLSQVGCQRCHKLVAAARQLVRDDRPQAEVSKLLRVTYLT
ncbi:hypothetical protein BOX15_Mlig000809g2 [Macrostomum lignano]|uniref:Saposin B-type domain-containing protein n=1 Tax=Macrostomum lignano TaxID=282301 RepID=A0A267FAR6_9PLAT|nr:hypothetical protein BOX15_Mlig000809g2 [Macrostomum lignano]